MSLLPLAALYPGDPDAAYRHAYEVGFFDNGFGRDLNSALVAGLAVALALPADVAASGAGWGRVLEAIRACDPYAYGKVPWVKRPVDQWLDLATAMEGRADGRPARVFARTRAEYDVDLEAEADWLGALRDPASAALLR